MEDLEDVLKGQTLSVYRYLLENRKPLSVRQVQSGMDFKSPSLAFYHLNKLQSAGLVELHQEGYVVKKVYLRHYVRLSRFLIPRYAFYFVFFALAFFLELLVLRPDPLTREYLFALAILFLGSLFFLYESVRIFLMERL